MSFSARASFLRSIDSDCGTNLASDEHGADERRVARGEVLGRGRAAGERQER